MKDIDPRRCPECGHENPVADLLVPAKRISKALRKLEGQLVEARKELETLQNKLATLEADTTLSALAADHADIAHVHNTLAMVAFGHQDFARTEAHHRQALAIQEQALGEHDLEIGRTLTFLGDFFLSQNKLTEAVDMHERAHKILVANTGDQSPDVGRSLNNLAQLYAAQNRLRDAADHHTQALAILEPALGPDDPEVKMVIDNLTALYSDIVPSKAKNTPQPVEAP